ncbi:MAG: UMP kinase [Deltaproteobacteria bacterium]|nr:UMP kinase [Deltaproteobacteria bacterium]
MGVKTVVLSLGGSIIAPENIDTGFLIKLKDLMYQSFNHHRFIIICGGGKICRVYQDAAKTVGEISKNDLDWIGIRATRLNAELVRSCFGADAYEKVIHDPDEEMNTDKRIIVGAGFKPGSSTDLRAVQLANRLGAIEVINMSNIDYVYSADPKTDSSAQKISSMSWPEFRKLVGDAWDPGMHMPFDPIASRMAEQSGLKVIIIGKDTGNLEKVLRGEAFQGTTIC